MALNCRGGMFTIHKMSVACEDDADALRAARYPLDRADAPQAFARAHYYTDRDPGSEGDGERANAIWVGTDRALEELGVARGKEVAERELMRTLQGRHVVSGAQVRRPGRVLREARDEDGQKILDGDGQPIKVKVKGVASLDLTFSAPKSVSVLWSQASPEARREIEHAMMIAANAAITYMMQTKPVTMLGRDEAGERIYGPAHGFVAALALHVTARRAHDEAVPSPQLHVHGVLVGGERADGTLSGIESSAMFKGGAMLEGGAVGRLVLADVLTKLGYEAEPDTGRRKRFFELRGVHRGLMAAMSGRTREVEAAIRELERKRGEKVRGGALAVVTSQCRAAKDKRMSRKEILAAWDALGQEFEFGLEESERMRGAGGYVGELAVRRDAAWAAVERRMEEQGPTVSIGAARAMVFEAAAGRLELEEAHELLCDMVRSGELIALEGGRATTQRIRALEQHVIESAARAANRAPLALSDASLAKGIEVADEALGEGRSLDAEQLAAIATLTEGRGWSTLTGRAGTGKTPVLHAVAAAYRSEGWQVIASASDGVTAQRLGMEIGGPAYTIQQVLAREKVGSFSLDARTLILIDEASKVGLALWDKLATLSERYQLRVLAVGHDGQLGAIELPGMYTEMLEHDAIAHAELYEIRRHRDPADPRRIHPWLRDYQVALDEGRATDAVDMLREHEAITLYDTREQAMRGLVGKWDELRDPSESRESIVVVHGPNTDVDRVNVLAQERRRDQGELAGEGVLALDRPYRIFEGDVVVLAQAAYEVEAGDAGELPSRRVENGTIGVVEAVDIARERVVLALREPGAEPRSVSIDLARLRDKLEDSQLSAEDAARVPSLRLAYAFHVFPIQGANVRAVGELAGHWSQGKEGTYVADTRGVSYLHVHGDRESLGTEGSEEDRFKRYAKRIATTQKKSASIHFEIVENVWLDVGLPPRAPVPEAPLRRKSEPVPVVIDRASIEIADPLARERRLLGERRTEQIERRAAIIGEELIEVSREVLCQEQEASTNPLELLDGAGAREWMRLERDSALTGKRMREALTKAGELDTRARAFKGPRARGQRRELESAAEVQRMLAVRERAGLAQLTGSQEELREQARDPDSWLAAHGEEAARWVAVEQELAVRRGLDIAERAERAVIEPPEHIREALGPAPEPDERERSEWEQLTRELETRRAAAEIDADHLTEQGIEPVAELGAQRALEERIEALRARRGMEPLTLALGVDSGEPDLGL